MLLPLIFFPKLISFFSEIFFSIFCSVLIIMSYNFDKTLHRAKQSFLDVWVFSFGNLISRNSQHLAKDIMF